MDLRTVEIMEKCPACYDILSFLPVLTWSLCLSPFSARLIGLHAHVFHRFLHYLSPKPRFLQVVFFFFFFRFWDQNCLWMSRLFHSTPYDFFHTNIPCRVQILKLFINHLHAKHKINLELHDNYHIIEMNSYGLLNDIVSRSENELSNVKMIC